MPLTHTTWTRKSPSFPEHAEYMEIIPEVRRIVCANVDVGDPVRYFPLAMYYVDVRDGLIRTQTRPDEPWKDNTYRMEGDLIIWNHDGEKEWPWKMISRDQLPLWFESFVEKAQARLNERTAAIRESKSKAQSEGGSA
jgi:hypothetical protein